MSDLTPEKVVLTLLWSETAERAYQAWAKENQGGVFPPDRESFVIALLNSVAGLSVQSPEVFGGA
jgi:hypothetical protein